MEPLSKKDYRELVRLSSTDRELTALEDKQRRELEKRLDAYGVPEGVK